MVFVWCDGGKNSKFMMNCQQQRVNLVVCASRGLVTVTAHGVVCKRLIPKEGKKFKTAALELAAVLSPTSCSSSTIEFNWPSSAELRDWVFFNHRG